MPPARVPPVHQRFTRVVEFPERAQNIKFRRRSLPKKYAEALQSAR